MIPSLYIVEAGFGYDRLRAAQTVCVCVCVAFDARKDCLMGK